MVGGQRPLLGADLHPQSGGTDHLQGSLLEGFAVAPSVDVLLFPQGVALLLDVVLLLAGRQLIAGVVALLFVGLFVLTQDHYLREGVEGHL